MMGNFADLTDGDGHQLGGMKQSIVERESWMDAFSHLTDMHKPENESHSNPIIAEV
jgi:hypothetical protein